MLRLTNLIGFGAGAAGTPVEGVAGPDFLVSLLNANYNNGLKPALWVFSPGLTPLEWWWFHAHCVGAWLPFSDDAKSGDGLIIPDRSLGGIDGTLDNSSGDLSVLVTPRGPSLNFSGDGTNDRLKLGSVTSSDRLSLAGKDSNFGICFGAMLETGHGTFPRVIDKSSGGSGANGWTFYQDTGKTPDAFIIKINSSTGLWKDDFIELNVFHHYAVSVKASDDADWYTDGVDQGTTEPGGALNAAPSNTSAMAIGNWNHSTARMWKGPIEYIYVFDAEIPRSIVNGIANDPFGPFRMTI